MEEKKVYDNTRILFCNKDEQGRRYGSGDWDDGVKIFLTNFRTEGSYMIADVTTPTLDTYINKAGQERFKHRTCGILKFTGDKAKIVVELFEGDKQEAFCVPQEKASKKDGRPFIMLDFSGKSSGPANPYADDVAGDLSDIPF